MYYNFMLWTALLQSILGLERTKIIMEYKFSLCLGKFVVFCYFYVLLSENCGFSFTVIPLEATDLLQKLSLDSQAKTLEIPEPTKKPSAESGDATNAQIQSYERSMTPLLQDFMDPSMYYFPNSYPYYYGSYDTANDWDDYSRYFNPEGVEMPPGVYGDNGSLMYQHGYGYPPYGPYSPAASPVPTMGHDGHLYGAQSYQYPAPYFQSLTPTSAPYNPTSVVTPKGEISTSIAVDQAPSSVGAANGNSNGIANSGGGKGAPKKQTYQNSSFNSNGSYGRGGLPGAPPASGFQDPRFSFDGLRSPRPWLDAPIFSDGQPRPVDTTSMVSSISVANNTPSSKSHNYRPHSHLVGLHQPKPMSGLNTGNGYVNGMYPNKLYGQYGSTISSGFPFGSNGYDSQTNGRGWMSVDNKYKPRGRNNGFFGYGNEHVDGLNELNRGPRAKSSKNQKGVTPVLVAVKGQNIPLNATNIDEKDKASIIPDREQYNKSDFPESYRDAKFFIIKSYSEDDVHKSIKYNVWASTPNGNKKLDAAYQEAQQKSSGCPVFLLFSVNTSGQFVGIAEMVGPVDFHKNFEYWQQDKWNGCFPVKWHIAKDVPNSLLKHITLENNENKPVTNSRDTQEVKLEQGLQMLKIFKDHSSRTCIVDDFDFYEGRQNTIQEKKAKQQQFQKQARRKPIDEMNKEGANGECTSVVASDLVKESNPTVQTVGDVNLSENAEVAKCGYTFTGAESAALSENRIATNGC
ncbi:evolutionarily conserved C-terminal region 4 [Actinidia rufa]|uniref:YTH domain-containing family protein n=1 Tax=Actinidia rufa TaxID=165716 RepID=A0A7J0HCJ7_9ERIC|nr:evolutionarily conserved C-terminal region 4 [Actinidia rufa]